MDRLQGCGPCARYPGVLVNTDRVCAWRTARRVRHLSPTAVHSFTSASEPGRSRNEPGANRHRARRGRTRPRTPLRCDELRGDVPNALTGYRWGRVGVGFGEKPRALAQRDGRLRLQDGRVGQHLGVADRAHPPAGRRPHAPQRGARRWVRQADLGGGISLSAAEWHVRGCFLPRSHHPR